MASSLLRALACAALMSACAAAPASAQFNLDPVDEVFGAIGLTEKPRPHIDYRERAPLVVPPSGTGLRPPESRAAVRGQRWPNDPDVAARRRKAEEAGRPKGSMGFEDEANGSLIRDSKTRNRYAGVPTQGIGGGDGGYNPARSISPDELRRINADAAPANPVYGEPNRGTLTDPPRGYRRAAGGLPIKSTVDPMRTGDDLQINLNQPRN